MRAGEDPGDTNPANKTAREQGFARLVKLLKEMKSAAAAGNSSQGGEVQARACHETGTAPTM
jgi:carboxymethylenebutenolidase